ncbi:uncharacterized protein BDR25DRAFT_342626 [Lindgomyces ingoldianus]|uniref:Uncharacterized protein n=1 Tax=Lindgomyces ingoldianus TaxID=673940 RepID=A0ACB6QXV5_9PLEO|nr:uncharacterized protein BDR25DRAFT_342626 [Lindgomyces ingoldianus]KAF2471355.1 hypothetical protein BDR25DRAFT_342626 [Lindgomyces ingoldianus]
MPTVAVFFKDKTRTFQPGLNNRLKDLINIIALGHLSIGIAFNVVKHNSACVRGVEADVLAADVQQGQELVPKISVDVETERQDHSVLRAPPTVGDDRALVSSRLFQDAVLVRAEEESEYDWPPAVDPDDNRWTVEKLIEKRRIGRAVKYLVKWLGYPDSANSWEKKKDIDPDIVAAFEAELLLAQDQV